MKSHRFSPYVLPTAVLLSTVGILVTLSRIAFAQTAQPSTSGPAGTYQVVSPKENYVWRLNTITGELYSCYNGPNGIVCARAPIPAR